MHLVFPPALAAPEHIGDGSKSVTHSLSEGGCQRSVWNVPLRPGEVFRFRVRWRSPNTSLCPFPTQIHAEIVDWLTNSSSFTTWVPRRGGLVPRLALPTGEIWSNLQSQGPLFGDKTKKCPALAFCSHRRFQSLLENNGLRGMIMLAVLFLSAIQIQGGGKLMPERGAASGSFVWMEEIETADLTPHYDH